MAVPSDWMTLPVAAAVYRVSEANLNEAISYLLRKKLDCYVLDRMVIRRLDGHEIRFSVELLEEAVACVTAWTLAQS